LAVLKKTDALLEGHFVLSSGLHSPQYVQCAKLLSKPNQAKKFISSLASKIKRNIKSFDIILSPAMGGVIIGYEIGRLLKKETIFCERVDKKFSLRRGFYIKKNTKVLIVEDVITTGKSSLECVKLIKKFGGKFVGIACLIDRSKKSLISKKIISQIKLDIPVFKKNKLPNNLKNIQITKPGSRYLR
jgi:orotate phosphoribosyltransferase